MTREAFLDLHVPGSPLLIPNPWDVGSARLMQSVGAQALATTSAGFAATLGHLDGNVSLEQVLDHCEQLSHAVTIPVSADFENGYAESLDEVADNYRLAATTGLSGASIEDWSGAEVYDRALAVERIQAARAAAPDLALTGRSEGYLRGLPDLKEAIERLNAFADAGADVLYAPGMSDLEEIRTLVREVSKPVNVLVLPGMEIAPLADAGVARISVGSWLAWAALGAAATATEAFLAGGTAWLADAATGGATVRPVLT